VFSIRQFGTFESRSQIYSACHSKTLKISNLPCIPAFVQISRAQNLCHFRFFFCSSSINRHTLTLSSSDVPILFTNPQLPINRNQSVRGKSDAVSVRRHAQTSVLSVQHAPTLYISQNKLSISQVHKGDNVDERTTNPERWATQYFSK